MGRENNMLKRAAAILAFGFVAAGCTHLATPSGKLQALGREELRNARGHVIGYKAVTRDAATGERITHIALFVPRLNARGRIIGYEERVRGGSVLLNLHGKRIGERFIDLRSRKGVTIVVLPREDRMAKVTPPSIDELIRLARLDN